MRTTLLIAEAVFSAGTVTTAFPHSASNDGDAPTIKRQLPESEVAFCHIASAKKDDVWTQFYTPLDD